MSIVVAVLAAGQASRFGGGKLDADCAGKPLGQWALEAVAHAGLAPGVILVADTVPAFARNAQGWTLLANRDAAEGLGTSLAQAARYARDQEADLLVLLADMPLIEPGHLAALASASGTAASIYPSGKPGVPAFFAQAILAKLASLTGDAGAGALLRHVEGLQLVEPAPGTLFDIDTAEELARAAVSLSLRE